MVNKEEIENGYITRNIYFTKQQDTLIQKYCQTTGNSVSGFLRMLVHDFFEKEDK